VKIPPCQVFLYRR